MNKKFKQLTKLKRADLRKLMKRRKKGEPDERLNRAIENLPQITNETVAEHREQLLSRARRYIYPLEHPRRRVLIWSGSILAAAIIVFFAYCTLALYKFQSTSTFIYRVTQVIPFPIAKAGTRYVAYENYLFQLRHYMHYYSSQQQVNFHSKVGEQQLASFKHQAMQEVINNAYIKQLAAEHDISVSDKEVNAQLQIVREQNRLGSSQQELADVLSEFWGWTIGDFRRELKQQLLAQKVVSQLDTATHTRAEKVLGLLKSGQKFDKLAAQYSYDAATKGNGGQYGFAIDSSSRDILPQLVAALQKLQPGQTSGIINTGDSLEIVELISSKDDSMHAAHIQFNFKSIDDYLKPLKAQHPQSLYISLPNG